MPSTYLLKSLDIFKEVNRIPSAHLTLLDGSVAGQKFEVSDTEFFEPGKKIEIKQRYEGQSKKEITIFKGLAVKHGVRFDGRNSYLLIDLKDEAVKLAVKRENNVFRDMKDSDIIAKIVKDGGLKTDKTAKTETKHKQMVQYYCTGWDFMVSRAEVNGLWVIADKGKISTNKPELSGSAKHTFKYGISPIYEFEMESDIQNQKKSIESTYWDVKKQELAKADKAKNYDLKQGNLDASKLASKIGADKSELIHPVLLESGETAAWADARMQKDRLSMLRGRIKVPGDAALELLDLIEIKGIGKRFNGTTLVTGIHHQNDRRGWYTDVQFGISNQWFARQNDDVTDLPAAGLLPAVHGLQIGIVEDFEDDPDKLDRVKIRIPAINSDDNTVWARLLSLDAGKKRGVFFRPEKNDEAVIGFLSDDPRQPIILGFTHSSKNTVPLEVEKENAQKGIVTREKLQLVFDDKKKSILLETPKGNKFLAEDEKGFSIKDKNGNKIIMDDKGIVLEDKNGNKIEAGSKGITIKTGKNIEIKGNQIKISGSKVDVN